MGLFWTGAALTALARLFHLVGMFGGRVVRGVISTSAGTVRMTQRQPAPPAWTWLGFGLSLIAGVCLAVMLVTRSIACGYLPDFEHD